MKGGKKRKISLKWDNSWNENDFPLENGEFDLKKFRLDIISIVRKIGSFWSSSESWKKCDDEGKIQLMLKNRKDSNDRRGAYSLKYKLGRVLKSVLERVYNKYFEKRKMSKDSRIEELIYAFFDEKTPLEKRDEEETNIQEFGDFDEELSFYELCDILLPKEILSQIFDYLERNYEVLTTIGLTCQYFYIHLLTTWDHIIINKKNLHTISLVALQNVKSLQIGKLTLVELNYLWKNLGNRRLRKICFKGESYNTSYFRSTLSSLQKLKKKRSTTEMNYPVQNVTDVIIHDSYWGSNVLKSTYKGIFPNITRLAGRFKQKCTIHLFPKRPQIRTLEFLGFEILGRVSYFGPMRKIVKPMGDLEDTISDPSNIKNLKFSDFHIFRRDDNKTISDSLKFFHQSNSFSLSTEAFSYLSNKKLEFDLTKIFGFSQNNRIFERVSITEKLKDHERKSVLHHPPSIPVMSINDYKNNSIPIIYSNEIQVKKFEVISLPHIFRYPHLSVLDFNLEDMLSSNFFLNGYLKSFKGLNIPIFRRSRIILQKIMCDNGPNQEDNDMFFSKMMSVIHEFMKFLRDSLVSEFDNFEILLLSYDQYFKNEYFFLRYDVNLSSVKRLRIKYGVYSDHKIDKEDEEEIEDKEENENFPITFHQNIKSYDNFSFKILDEESFDKKTSKVFLMEGKRPCLLITHYFLEAVMRQMMEFSMIDVICFSFEHSSQLSDDNERRRKRSRVVWKDYILGIFRSDEFMKKEFTFDEEDISFVRKNLN